MSGIVKVRVAFLLKAIADAEKQTEIVRGVLAEQKLFEPYTAFRRLDQARQGGLRLNDLLEFLADNNIEPKADEANYLFKRVDIDKDGIISYQDFVSYVLPLENDELRQLVQLRDSYYIDVGMLLPNEVECALSRLLETELDNYNEVRSKAKQLANFLDQDQVEGLGKSNLFNQGLISPATIQNFVDELNIDLVPQEAQSVIRYFNPNGNPVTHKQFFSFVLGQNSLSSTRVNQQQNPQQRQQQSQQQYPPSTSPFEYQSVQQVPNPMRGTVSQSQSNLRREDPSGQVIDTNGSTASFGDGNRSSYNYQSSYNYKRTTTTTTNSNRAPQASQQDNENDRNRANTNNRVDYRLDQPQQNKKQNIQQAQSRIVQTNNDQPKNDQAQNEQPKNDQSRSRIEQSNLDVLLRERERQIEREILAARSADRVLLPVYPPFYPYYPYYPTVIPLLDPELDLSIIRRQRLAELETESRLLDLEKQRREDEQKILDEIAQREKQRFEGERKLLKELQEKEEERLQALREAQAKRLREAEEQERQAREEYLSQSRLAQQRIQEENERLRRLREASQILDEEIRYRSQNRSQQLKDLKNMTPEQQRKYFDPNEEYPYGIIEAINEYNPTGDTPNKYPKYSAKKSPSASPIKEQDPEYRPRQLTTQFNQSTYSKTTVTNETQRVPVLP